MAVKQLVKRVILPAPGPHRLLAGAGRGIRMEIDFGRNTRLYAGLYEIELTRSFRRLLWPGAACFDVGAQLGYHTLLFASLTRGRVAAFDPDPGCLSIARRNVGLNPELGAHIELVGEAVGDGPSEIGLDEYAFSAAGFVPDFVKVDVDGGEAGVLRSAERLLSERHPGLVVETHSLALEAQCAQLLAEHGYRPVIVNQRRLLPDRRLSECNRWLVCEFPPVAVRRHSTAIGA